MDSRVNESDLIEPTTPLNEIPENALLYLANLSTSNVIIPTDGRNIVLNATGKNGSVQIIDREVLKTAGVASLWHARRIGVSTSAKVAQKAISEIELREREEQMKEAEVMGEVEYQENNGAGGIDISYVADDYTDEMTGIDPGIVAKAKDHPSLNVYDEGNAAEDAPVEVEEAPADEAEKPAKTTSKGRGRKTTSAK